MRSPVPEFSHLAWTSSHTHNGRTTNDNGRDGIAGAPTGSRTYTRPYGDQERCFYWDTVLNGTADCIQVANVEVLEPHVREEVFSRERVERAWVYVKHMHPLLGVYIQGPVKDGASVEEIEAAAASQDEAALTPHFVVSEEALRKVHTNELEFLDVKSEAQVFELVDQINNGPPGQRVLSLTRTAKLYILFRTDEQERNIVSVLALIAHCVVDGMGLNTFMASFFDALTNLKSQDVGSPSPKLDERLYFAQPTEVVWPKQHLYSMARRRWRKAIASVIFDLRQTRMKGGHTLPRKLTTATSFTPAETCYIHFNFTPEQSSAILTACRKYGVTFGHVFYVLGQISMARLLLRCYRAGKISQDEWEFRKREPWVTGGPANVRPMLDEEWYKSGGKTSICVSIGFFFIHLPFMALGEAEKASTQGQDEPGYDKFMSRGRFLLRSQMVKKQVLHQMKHPLFLEIVQVRLPQRTQSNRAGALKWQAIHAKGGWPEGEDVPVPQQGLNGPVWGHIGSSMGDLSNIIPMDYPPNIIWGPQLHIDSMHTRLHCRPTELYLGSRTAKGRLWMNVFWDGRTYDRETVKEWLDEVKEATLYYLGDVEGKVSVQGEQGQKAMNVL